MRHAITPVSAARLCALGGGFQLVWGAILAVSLQERTTELAGTTHAVGAYAVLAAAGAAVATIVQLCAGALSDRRSEAGRRPFYFVGVGGAIPALFLLYLAPTYPILFLAFLLLQGTLNIAIGPYQAIIPDYVEPPRRGRASAWMAAYASLGNAGGLVIAGFVHDVRAVAVALATALGGSFAVTMAQIENRTTNRGEMSASASLGPLLSRLLVSRGFANIGFFTMLGFLLFYVRESLRVSTGAVQMQTALLFLTFTLCAIGGAVAAARPTDRFDARAVVTVAITIIAAALIALAVARSLPVAYGAAGVAGIGWGAFVTADWALATRLLPPRSMATAMGVWNIATTIPQIVAPLMTAPLVGALSARGAGDGPRGAIALSTIEFLFGAWTIWRLPRV